MTRSTEKLIRVALRDGCREHCDALIDELRRLHAQRDALLEALMKLEYSSDGCIKRYPEESEVNAAIKKAEENT